MTTAARLPLELVALPAAIVTLGAVAVLLAGVVAAARAPAHAGARFAAHVTLALDLLLAAGLIRLAALDDLRALATVAGVVLVRQVLSRGVRFGAGASEAR